MTPCTSVNYSPQITSESFSDSTQTISDFLEYSEKLEALARITLGNAAHADFDLVGDDWMLEEELKEQLKLMALPEDYRQRCSVLSGGQLARLQIFKVFRSAKGLLILDEPSNHLDAPGRQWLLKQITSFKGNILLVSHDRHLLQHVDEILELKRGILSVYGGNYDYFAEQVLFNETARHRKLEHAIKTKKILTLQHQKSESKAATRAKQGKKTAYSGSQAPILMGAMKRAAQVSSGAKKAGFEKRREEIDSKISELKAQSDMSKPLSFTLGKTDKRKSRVLDVIDLALYHGSNSEQNKRISFSLDYGEKLRLTGANGCGKSSLLKVIAAIHQPRFGHVVCRCRVCYLDQHFSILELKESAFVNLKRLCPNLGETELRTLLASMGLRGDKAFLSVEVLSGGERMKLAMVAVSHQSTDTLLLLDEPDNHLDLKSKKHLAELLSSYTGSFILVSHDTHFVTDSGITTELSMA